MKFKKLSYLSFLGILALGLTCSSCDKDLPGENGTNTEKPEGGSENGENGGDDTPDDGTILTPLEQKEKLSAIGQEFMNAIPSSDFDDITNTLQDVSDKYGENYNWEDVEEWAEDCWDKTLEYLGEETENYDYGYYVSTYIYKNVSGQYKICVWDFNNACDNYMELHVNLHNFDIHNRLLYHMLCRDEFNSVFLCPIHGPLIQSVFIFDAARQISTPFRYAS